VTGVLVIVDVTNGSTIVAGIDGAVIVVVVVVVVAALGSKSSKPSNSVVAGTVDPAAIGIPKGSIKVVLEDGNAKGSIVIGKDEAEKGSSTVNSVVIIAGTAGGGGGGANGVATSSPLPNRVFDDFVFVGREDTKKALSSS
jgi:hypothetical protein